MGEIISGERRIETDALAERAARAAAGLASLGVGRGDTVAVYLRNDLPFFEASYAAGRLGAYPTPVNWHYTEDEARYLFENSGARAILIHADLLEPVRSVLPPGVPVLVIETPPEVAEAYGVDPGRRRVPDGMIDWSRWLEEFAAIRRPRNRRRSAAASWRAASVSWASIRPRSSRW
jgi:long-chain acyl-CoA synthetase